MLLKDLGRSRFLPPSGQARLGIRLAAGAGAMVIWSVMVLASFLQPDPRGLGTHEQLGFPECGFYERTGWPCPTCGMTTSFSYVSRGQIVKAFIVQPAGAVTALLGLILSLFLFDEAVSGVPWHLRLVGMNIKLLFIIYCVILLIGWMWCCVIHVG
ncbi:MAG: DUF2752 domain-containing protein [Sedimentisphaerales bacterium]|nr:DUF2752 domain-containing protein [Sedimentisphaerales bacterium]